MCTWLIEISVALWDVFFCHRFLREFSEKDSFWKYHHFFFILVYTTGQYYFVRLEFRQQQLLEEDEDPAKLGI